VNVGGRGKRVCEGWGLGGWGGEVEAIRGGVLEGSREGLGGVGKREERRKGGRISG